MKRLIINVGLGTALMVTACQKEPEATERPSAEKSVQKSVAAIVNGQPITMAEFEARLQQVERQRAQFGVNAEAHPLNRLHALDSLIEERVIMAKVAELGITVTDAEVQAEAESIVKARREAGDASSAVNQDMLASLRMTMIRHRLAETLTGANNVSQADAQAFYNQMRARFFEPARAETRTLTILVAHNADPATRERAMKRAQTLYRQAPRQSNKVEAWLSKLQRTQKGVLVTERSWVDEFKQNTPSQRHLWKSEQVGWLEPALGLKGIELVQVIRREERRPMSFEEAEPKVRDVIAAQRRLTNLKELKALVAQAKVEQRLDIPLDGYASKTESKVHPASGSLGRPGLAPNTKDDRSRVMGH